MNKEMNKVELTVKELKTLAKNNNIVGYSKMKKEELISSLINELPVTDEIEFISANSCLEGYVTTKLRKANYTKKNYYAKKILNKWHFDFIKENISKPLNDIVCNSNKVKGNILLIDSKEHYLLARELFGTVGGDEEDVTYINLNNVSKFYDGIMFTYTALEECDCNDKYSLSEFEYEFIKVFDYNKVTNGLNIITTQELLDKVSQEVNDAKCEIKKREQYYIRNVNIMDMVFDTDIQMLVLPKGAGITVPTSENRMFRNYKQVEYKNSTYKLNEISISDTQKSDIIDIDKENNTITIKEKVNKVPSFIIVNAVPNTIGMDNKQKKKTMELCDVLLDVAIYQGFINQENGKGYKVCAQSASQARSGKHIYTCEDVDKVRGEMLYQYDFGDKFVIATKEARNGLAFTSAILLEGFHPTIKVLPDPVEKVKTRVIVPTGVNKEKGTVEIIDKKTGQILVDVKEVEKEIQPNDGGALMQIIPFAEACCKLGIISKNDFLFFKSNFTTVADLKVIFDNQENATKDELRLLKIFLKLPSVLQIRYGGSKGLVAKFPVKEYRPDLEEDIIAGENFVKFQLEDYSNVNFEVCGVPKEEEELVAMNYQFLQFLNLDKDTLCQMAEEQLDKINEQILKNPQEAMKFLGMIENVSSSTEDTGLVSKFTKVLATNPDMLQDSYVQKNIKSLMSKFIYSIAFGKLPVQGSYKYVFSDPFHFLAQGSKNINGLLKYCMSSEENFCNNYVGEMALLRPPMTSGDEIQLCKFIKNEHLWFMSNLLILNCYSLTLAGAGGANQ